MEIKELRQILGLSQESFARKINVSLRTVIRWEQKITIPRKATMRKIDKLIRKISRGK